nr:HepT-like ribonuclease domain-containing protein [Marinomonas ostreistagni]
MIQRLDAHRQKERSTPLSQDEIMAVEHTFQLLIASMLDLARYMLEHHYAIDISTRDKVLDALIEHQDVTYEQGQQIKALVDLRQKILFDYLEENFDVLSDALQLRRYGLVEVLTKEWLARLDSTDH